MSANPYINVTTYEEFRSFADHQERIDADMALSHLHEAIDDLLNMYRDNRQKHVKANQASTEEAARKLFGIVELMRREHDTSNRS